MKKKLSLLLAVMLLVSTILAVPVCAEEEGSTPSSAPTESKPTEPAPSEESKPEESKPEESKPTEPDPSTPTQGSTPTEPSETRPCTHTYGDWDANEGSHWKVCTACGHRESAGHSWASETVTVDPTCGEYGGICKVCTVCQGVLVTQLIDPTGKHTYDNACDTSCNVCGATRTITHTFGTGWKYSGKGHWHYCTVCGAAGEVKDHYPGPAATEEKDQICLTCGMVMMKKKEHTHKWDTKWSSDGSSHWYTCTVCQEKDKIAAHAYDDGCDTDCNDCGYVRTAAHTYGPEWTQTESAHYGVCTVCGESGTAEEHIADSTGTCCAVCGYAMEAAEETHQHEFLEDTWGFDANGHWNLCMCGETGEAAPHVWDDGKKMEKNTILYRCDVCGAEKQAHTEQNSFHWLLAAAGGAVLICLIGIVACVVMIRRNREEDE